MQGRCAGGGVNGHFLKLSAPVLYNLHKIVKHRKKGLQFARKCVNIVLRLRQGPLPRRVNRRGVMSTDNRVRILKT